MDKEKAIDEINYAFTHISNAEGSYDGDDLESLRAEILEVVGDIDEPNPMLSGKRWLDDQVLNMEPKTIYHNGKPLQSTETTIYKIDVLNLISQLKEPEILSKDWIREHSKAVTYDGIPDETEIVYVDDLQKLLVPKLDEPKRTLGEEWQNLQIKGYIKKHERLQALAYEIQALTNWSLEEIRDMAQHGQLEKTEETKYLAHHIKEVENSGLIVIKKPIIPQFMADWIESKAKELPYIHSRNYRALIISDYFKLVGQGEIEKYAPKNVIAWLTNGKVKDFMIAVITGLYEVEEVPTYVIEIGNGYFTGYDDNKVTYVLDDKPGSEDQAIIYDDYNKADIEAAQIGGVAVRKESDDDD